MKKTLIAGASLALAAMPVVGVFATDPTQTVTDHISLTVAESCTFTTGGSDITPSASAVTAGTEATFTNGTHSFVIGCNSKSYTVSATATDLVNSAATSHGTIGYVDNSAYTTATAATPIAEDGVWTAILTGGKANAEIGKTQVTIKEGTSTSTDQFSVQYKALAGKGQNQGTYSGTVEYVLAGSNS